MLISIHKFGHEIIRNPIFAFETIWVYFGQLLRVLSVFQIFRKSYQPSNKNLTSSRTLEVLYSHVRPVTTLIALAPKAQKSLSGEKTTNAVLQRRTCAMSPTNTSKTPPKMDRCVVEPQNLQGVNTGHRLKVSSFTVLEPN